ncbi:ErfK/YbiS/YcfS/YnhG family protein [Emticicia oligotrophica DSM 17448]|uniref:ErfK/YbiS/YcfS/YnhG family protein n=1 Tax=Emticicia oligotrophica (strain DSM 17448 / CIP 109782 / MTCC 6937 / GPTSA100-15) TaxID=929562 RepID=A0ABM5N3F1_EMTOG|nr:MULTISPECIES: L,D-transpeptidase family protein [Emticicia]AFK03970.1 ErfK/YbiS/YcfS/YnhG family protein [Emticicia oligotrophica DSM 17448]
MEVCYILGVRKTKIFLKLITFFTLISIVGSISSCKNKQKKKVILADESVYSAENFTHLTVDSLEIADFFKTFEASDSIKNEVLEFYKRRNFQFAWINKDGLTHAAPDFYVQLQNFSDDFQDNSLKNHTLDSLLAEAESDSKSFLKQKDPMHNLELLLTSTFFKFADKAYTGTTKDPIDLEWFIPRKKKNYQILLDSLVSAKQTNRVQEPVNQYYIALKEKLRQYREIQKKGGFPKIITTQKPLNTGDRDSLVQSLNDYLVLTGDLKQRDTSSVFSDSLSVAIKRFQQRMGLKETGKINAATLSELNIPIEARIKQMMINMERLRWAPVELENNYLMVNIPEFKLHIFENKKLSWDMSVVVGKAATKTSIFRGDLSMVVLNPYWNVPTSIIQNEIMPKLQNGISYLSKNDMEVLSGNKVIDPSTVDWTKYANSIPPYNFRQRPGNKNSLGKIKFLFPNSYSIYLHDTPSKGLFNESARAFSHGCIRLSEPRKLALYLLRNNPNWSSEKVDEILEKDEENFIKLKPALPVYIVYFTTWVSSNGQLNFRKDIYGLDKKLSEEVFSEITAKKTL